MVTSTKDQKTMERTTVIHILPYKLDTGGVVCMEEIYSAIRELKDNIQVHPTNKLSLILGDGLNQAYVRKICEYIFYGTEMRIALLTPKRTVVARRDVTRAQTHKVVVRSGQESYADLLKSVKDNIDLGKVGVCVKTIKKSIGGDLVLEVSGDRQNAGALKEAISRKLEKEVRLVNNLVTVHVLDIDATTTKAQVEEALRKSTGCDNSQSVVVTSLRPTRDGNQIATCQTNGRDAALLVRTGRIKIGWVNCRIRERVVVPRCYKCLEFGHVKKDCKGPDRSDRCINCNQPGHRAKEYSGAHYCPGCDTNDHRADTNKCPKFRALLKAERRQKLAGKEKLKRQDQCASRSYKLTWAGRGLRTTYYTQSHARITST